MNELSYCEVQALDRLWEENTECTWEEVFTFLGNGAGNCSIEKIHPIIYVKNVEIKGKKIRVSCTVRYQFIYWTESNSIKSFSADRDGIIERELEKEAESCFVDVSVESINVEASGAGKIRAMIKVKARLNCKSITNVQYVAELPDDERFEVKKSTLNLSEYMGVEKLQTVVEERITAPNNVSTIREILFYLVSIREKNEHEYNGVTYVKGTLALQICYIDEDENDIHYLEREIEFSQEFEKAEESKTQTIYSHMQLAGMEIMVSEDEDGEMRVFEIKATVAMLMNMFEEREHLYIEDAYSDSFEALQESQNILTVRAGTNETSTVRETLEIIDAESVNVIGIDSQMGEYRFEQEGSEVWIIGEINIAIYYFEEKTTGIKCFKTKLSLRKKVEISWTEEVKFAFNLIIQKTGWNCLDKNIVEVWCEVGEESYFIIEKTYSRINEIKEVSRDANDKQPGVKVYFSQKDESLWRIGKKFGKTMESLRKYNPHLCVNELEHSTQVLILT